MIRRSISRNGPSLIVMSTSKRIWRRIRVLTILITAVALAAAGTVYAWSKGVFLPGWIEWKERALDLSEDRIDLSEIVLENRRLRVEQEQELLWESPENILVQDFLWCDINHDKEDELILLCWRIGRYGDARPYWVEEDEKKWSQHIYIYQWRDEEIHPLWMASDIGMDVTRFEADQKERILITETDGRKTVWDWMSWGLTLVEKPGK